MVREIMTDYDFDRADRAVQSKATKKFNKTVRRPARDLDASDVEADGNRMMDRLAESQDRAVDRLTRQWDGPRRFIDERPRADRYVYVLLRELTALDADAGRMGTEWYEVNREKLTTDLGSEWIKRLKVKIARTPGNAPAAAPVTKRTFDDYTDIPSGNYALQPEGDKTHFYRISRSKPDGNGRVWVRVKERASDELFPVRPWRRAVEILEAIRTAGVETSGQLFAERLGRCRNCFKLLTDEDNPYKIYGYGPDCGPNCT